MSGDTTVSPEPRQPRCYITSLTNSAKTRITANMFEHQVNQQVAEMAAAAQTGNVDINLKRTLFLLVLPFASCKKIRKHPARLVCVITEK